jgi:uncharacterized cupin superfamily protein
MAFVWDDLYLLAFSFMGLLGGLSAAVVAYLVHVKSSFLRYRQGVAQRSGMPLEPYTVSTDWIVSGSPVFRSNVFGNSHDKSTATGLWECAGPAEFIWHYGTDESIYILEGSADVEYLGRKFTLRPGDCTHFVLGTTAKWSVTDRVKKCYTLYEPGRLVRKVRRLLRLLRMDAPVSR